MSKVRDKKYIRAFGIHLKQMRESKKLTQEALANMSEIARSQIIRFENGERSPTISTLKAIAEGLKVKPKDLLDFEI